MDSVALLDEPLVVSSFLSVRTTLPGILKSLLLLHRGKDKKKTYVIIMLINHEYPLDSLITIRKRNSVHYHKSFVLKGRVRVIMKS